jgi:hypothetical protein
VATGLDTLRVNGVDEGAHMSAFTTGILQRIHTTESDLRKARETGDEFLAEVEQSELEDLQRLAAEHGVDVRPKVA